MGLEGLRVDLCPPFSSNVSWTKTPTPTPLNVSLRGSRGRQSHTAISCQPMLLVSYMQTKVKRLEHWLQDWRIDVSVPTSTTMLFVEAAIVSQKPWYVRLFGEPIQWVDTGRHLRVTSWYSGWRDYKPSEGWFSFLLTVPSRIFGLVGDMEQPDVCFWIYHSDLSYIFSSEKTVFICIFIWNVCRFAT